MIWLLETISPLTGWCVTLDKTLNLFVPQFHHLGEENIACTLDVVYRSNKIACVNNLVQSETLNKSKWIWVIIEHNLKFYV